MTSAASIPSSSDRTSLPLILRHALQLGVIEAILVLAFSLASRILDGGPELIARSAVVLVGLAATTLLPGLWTRPRTIEGIAGAAGIGLAASWVFLVIDVALLQPLGTYSNRWLEIGGGSNWWYHPVWWMLGTYLPWMGAFALSNRARHGAAGGAGSVGIFGLALVLAGGLGTLATAIGFPGASLNLPTFAVAYVPALALTVLFFGRGRGRGRR